MSGQSKPIDKTKTLEHAKEAGDLEPFIAEHENDAPGQAD